MATTVPWFNLTNYVYVYFMDRCWRLTKDEWTKVCADAAKGNLVVPEKAMLKGPPRWLRIRTDGRVWIVRNDVTFYDIRKWGPEEFLDHLEAYVYGPVSMK